MSIQKIICYICGLEDASIIEIKNDVHRINCKRCKIYQITEQTIVFNDIKEQLRKYGAELTGLSRYLNDTNGVPFIIKTDNIQELISDSLIPEKEDIERKANYLLTGIKRNMKFFGRYVELNPVNDTSLAFTLEYEEFGALLKLLADSKLIEPSRHGLESCIVRLTAKGFTECKKKTKKSKQAFIAIWFDKNGSMNDAIQITKQAVTKTGFTPICIIDEYYPETIIEKAIGEIKQSRFVIVNLTGKRPSVFFEAGFAYGQNLDVIFVCDEQEQKSLEFYSKHYKIYFYNSPADLEEKLIDVIKARIL